MFDSAGTILDHYRRLKSALGDSTSLSVTRLRRIPQSRDPVLLAEEGAGFDIVSGGELFEFLRRAGTADDALSPASVNRARKSNTRSTEKVLLLQRRERSGAGAINRIAGDKKMRAPIALRMNPDIEAGATTTSPPGAAKINSGSDSSALPPFTRRRATALHLHSRPADAHRFPDYEAEPFADAIAKVAPLVRDLKTATRNRVF